MALGKAQRGQALVGKRQRGAPWRDRLRQGRSLRCCLFDQVCTTLGQAGQFLIHERDAICCRSLRNSDRVAANSFGFVLAL